MLLGIGMYTRKPLPRGFPYFFLFYEVMEEKKMAKTCNNCGTENVNVNVPYVVHEATVARQERQIKRMWIALIVLVVALFLTNMAWIGYQSQFDTFSYEQDGDGINNVNVGEQGDIINGTESENKAQKEQK